MGLVSDMAPHIHAQRHSSPPAPPSTGGPFFVCFLLLSFLNQLVRKAACLTFSKKLNGDVDAKQTFTSLAHAKLAYMGEWNWGATLRNVNYLAIAGWVVKFGSTLTYMGLRWMIDLMLGADLSCGASSGIFLLVGLYCVSASQLGAPLTAATVNPFYIAGSLCVPVSWGLHVACWIQRQNGK